MSVRSPQRPTFLAVGCWRHWPLHTSGFGPEIARVVRASLSGFESSEVPGGAPRLTERVIPHRYASAASVVLCGFEVGDAGEVARAVGRVEAGAAVGRVVADRITAAPVGNGSDSTAAHRIEQVVLGKAGIAVPLQ